MFVAHANKHIKHYQIEETCESADGFQAEVEAGAIFCAFTGPSQWSFVSFEDLSEGKGMWFI